MAKKYKYRYSKKSAPTSAKINEHKEPSATNISAKKRMLLLLGWSSVAVGIYVALSQKHFIYSLWFFAFILTASAILYLINRIKLDKYSNLNQKNSEEYKKLENRGKYLLIVMIPTVFIIMYDFISSLIKIFV